ncbi:hypothetical protein C8Q78DRAFT_1192430, partial [Trametes maxima]
MERLRAELEQLELNSPRKAKTVRVASPPSHPRASSGRGPADALVESSISAARLRSPQPRSGVEAASRLRPVTQVEPDSYLGHAFKELNDRHGTDGDSDPSSSSSSESDDQGSSREDAARRKKRKYRRKLRERERDDRARAASVPRVPVLKPREPKPYNGTADVRTFHKFVQEMTAYIDGYQLPPARHAVTVSYFLTGRAYDCYTVTISASPREWTLRDILVEVFNYCFPVDFRQTMRLRLGSAKQGARSVREYVHELQELFLMVGSTASDERSRVEKLWYGLRPKLQSRLWLAHLNPATASWSEVQAEAEIAELALAASAGIDRYEDGSTPRGQANRGSSGAGGSSTMGAVTRPSSSRHDRRDRNRPNRDGQASRPKLPTSGRTEGRAGPRDHEGSRAGPSQPRREPPQAHRMSEREKDELRAAGKCFVCKEAGHMSRNCPTRARVPGDSRGRPPGVTSFSVEFVEAEQWQALSESTTRIEEIQFNSIEFSHPSGDTFSDDGSLPELITIDSETLTSASLGLHENPGPSSGELPNGFVHHGRSEPHLAMTANMRELAELVFA